MLLVSRKAISEIISVLLVALITTALIGTVYIWGSPMITKRQHATKVGRVYSYFNEESSNSLVYKIEYVAKHGGRETFYSSTDGVWTLREYGDPMTPDPNNNSI
jgi:FlaG/FlaF family flagellin (archaellin)